MIKTFENEYNRLNTAQKRAVDTIEGPVMVIAGPGTGKTQILTLRIANILKRTQASPENILALTFTESGVSGMRKRLAELIGSEAYQVTITTFHSFANDIIKKYPEYFPNIIGSDAITEVEQITILQDIIENTKLELLKPYGDVFLYVKDISHAIKSLKREGMSPEEFTLVVNEEIKQFEQIEDLVHEKGVHKGKMKGKYVTYKKQIDKNKELASVYVLYQESLREKRGYDFEDMIVEVLRALRKEAELLLILQEQYQYILVDEHQDTNNAQNKILALLLNFHDNPNIFVVGDEKQAVYRFQGASLENFYYFTHLYPAAEVVNLSENYRSTQRILDSAHSIIPKEEKLKAALEKKDHPISLVSLPSLSSEMFYVTDEIQKLLAEGTIPSEIAVLYRNNKDAYGIIPLLDAKQVPYRVESDKSIFEESIAKKILILLEAIEHFGNDEKVARALHLDLFGVTALDAYKIIHAKGYKRKKGLCDMLRDKKELSVLSLEDQGAVEAWYKQMSVWAKEVKNIDAVTFFGELIHASGIVAEAIRANIEYTLSIVDRLYDEIKSLSLKKDGVMLSDFLDYVDTVKKHNLLIKQGQTQSDPTKIRLMTAHRSKGLEFEHVFIINAYEGHFGGRRHVDRLKLLPRVYKLLDIDQGILEEDSDADERRLFYVALTRAKKSVVITYSKKLADGKELLPSKFATDIQESLIERKDISEPIKGVDLMQSFSRMPVRKTISNEFVREVFLKQGLSVTALNNYLKSPWQYFYQNLIRIPSVPNKHQAYGISVHSALQYLFTAIKREEEVSKEMLIDKFRYYLGEQLMTDSDQKETQKKGEKSLSEWFDGYSETWNTDTQSEFMIRGVLLTPEIRLTGKLDKLEFLGSQEVNVVDYKTGKPKTKNDILGNTKTSDGNYYRQLVFYKLLLQLFKEGKYNMVSGEIDFIEPDNKGGLHKEKFEIPNEDVEDLKETILRVSDEIMNLSFWNIPCDPEKCDYCDLVDIVKEGSEKKN